MSDASSQAFGPIQYIADSDGHIVSAVVPIEVWREIESERETAYLLKSDAMRRRLAEARSRDTGLSLEQVRAQAGI